MPTITPKTRRRPLIALCVLLAGLLMLWAAQPILPSWACAASIPAQCPAHILPFRASAITFTILTLLLTTISIGLALQSKPITWLSKLSQWTIAAVPLILVLTALAHFLLPQP